MHFSLATSIEIFFDFIYIRLFDVVCMFIERFLLFRTAHSTILRLFAIRTFDSFFFISYKCFTSTDLIYVFYVV